jgi:hypothetical protein
MKHTAHRILGMTAMAVLALGSGYALAQGKRSSGIEFHGFVQTSWQGNYTSGQNDFRVEEIQVDVGKEWRGTATTMLRLNYRHVDNFDAQNRLLAFDYNRLVEQAWVSVDLLKKRLGLTFTFGKFALPIGQESVNIPEMHTYSRSYTVQAGIPNFGTGLMARFQKSIFDIALYAVTGWNTISDNNDAKTFGGRLGFSLFDGDLTFGVSYVAGPEPIPVPGGTNPNVRSARHVVDVDLLFTGVKRLIVGAELNYGYENEASQVVSGRRARWLSALGTVRYKFLPWLSGTLRFEHADDPDGSRMRLLDTQWVGSPAPQQWLGVPVTVESLTVAALLHLARNVSAVLEWRNDWLARSEDRPVFPAGGGLFTKTRRLVAASMYFAW